MDTSEIKADLGITGEHIEDASAEARKDGPSTSQPPPTHVDRAAQVVADGPRVEVSVEEDRRVLRLIDLWVMAPMMVIYFLQQLDKSSLSYTSVFGIVAQTHLVRKQYSWLSSVVYLAQLVFQPLKAWALVKLPIAPWVCFNLLCWGITVACSAAAKDFKGLVVARMFLGIFESCVAPSFMLLVQTWWRRREQTYRTMGWNASNALAGTFGPLIAFGIGHAASQKFHAYQAIFVFCGCLTILCVPFIYLVMPSSPVDAKFLRHGDDRKIAIERLRANNMGVESHVWKWAQFFETLSDPKSYLWVVLLFLAACPSGGIGAFGGLTVQSFGYNSFHTIPWRLLVIQPLLYSWANLNAAEHTKKVTTSAMLFVAQCVGNVVGPLFYKTEDKPYYHDGLTVDLICWALLAGIATFTGFYLTWLNRKQEIRRQRLGQKGKVVDTSLLTLEDVAAHRKQQKLDQPDGDLTENTRAFDDLTDFENPDFIYVV